MQQGSDSHLIAPPSDCAYDVIISLDPLRYREPPWPRDDDFLMQLNSPLTSQGEISEIVLQFNRCEVL